MNILRTALFSTGVAVALAVGFWAGQDVLVKEDSFSPALHMLALNPPKQLAVPPLQKSDGGVFDTASLQDRWSLVFFGYTHCPDVCPSTLTTLAQAKKKMEQENGQFPQVVFISVDPQRDTVPILDKYVSYFDKDFIAATGEDKLLRAISVQTGANYIVEPSENENAYQVGHSLMIVLVNPKAQMVAVISPPHSVDNILESLQQFL